MNEDVSHKYFTAIVNPYSCTLCIYYFDNVHSIIETQVFCHSYFLNETNISTDPNNYGQYH